MKVRYIHSSYPLKNGSTRQTIAYHVTPDEIKWQLAVCDKEDEFRKNVGRDIATGKLVGEPFVIDNDVVVRLLTSKLSREMFSPEHTATILNGLDLTTVANNVIQNLVEFAAEEKLDKSFGIRQIGFGYID